MRRWFRSALVVICCALAAGETTKPKSALVPPAKRDVPGKRFSVSLGNLYVPDFFKPDAGGTDIVMLFHGAAWCAEQNFYDAKKNAVLVTVSLGMPEYARVFADVDAYKQIIRATEQKLIDEEVASAPIGRVCLSSFSGGYTAIRELLKHDDVITSVTDVVLADSLYAPRQGDGPPDYATLRSFVHYAKRAAAGDCKLLFTQLYPPEQKHRNNTTTLTAKYLIEEVGARKKPASGKSSRGAKILYSADKGGFHVIGYEGMTTQDHFEHFYGISDLWKRISFKTAQ